MKNGFCLLNVFVACMVWLLTPTIGFAQTMQTPSFYVAAHPDDAQLFRGDQMADDVKYSYVRLIQVVVTAGNSDRYTNWWQSREWGAVASLEKILGWPAPTVPAGCRLLSGWVNINGHDILRYQLVNAQNSIRCVLYCMRLPDGGPYGKGYPNDNGPSLAKLAQGAISSITTIDRRATYYGIGDVTWTLKQILINERLATNPNIHPWLNANEYDGMTIDKALPRFDHSDHRTVGNMLKSFAQHDGFNRAWWISYSNGYGQTIGQPGLSDKYAMFQAYVDDMTRSLQWFAAQTPPSGENWQWSGTRQQKDQEEWASDWKSFGPYSYCFFHTWTQPD